MSVPSMTDRALLRAEQTDQRLQEHRLTGTRRTEQCADLTRGKCQRHVLPNPLRPERLGQSFDRYLDSHHYLRDVRCMHAPVWVGSLYRMGVVPVTANTTNE